MKRFGISVIRYPRAENGPRVWQIMVRVGRKKTIPVDGCHGGRHVWDVPNGIDPGLGAYCQCGREEWDQ